LFNSLLFFFSHRVKLVPLAQMVLPVLVVPL